MLSTTTTPLIIFLAFAFYGLMHTLTASLSFKDRVSSLFGETARRYYRLVYTILAFVTFLPVLALPAWLPDVHWYTVPSPWRYLMVLGQFISLGALTYSLLQIGAFQFIGLPQALGRTAKDELNTGGLYRYMRHPLYTFTITLIWLTPVMTQNLAALNTAITLYALIGAVFEERKLVRIYGKAYRDYRSKTPMFLPLPRSSGN
jgi:protein-S-isoprenylcysteine O-methyltransferase Ste14